MIMTKTKAKGKPPMVRYLGKAYHNILSLPITGNRATDKNVKKLKKLIIKIIILIT